jgi:2-polyprenyl-3-methyl-5-hydroxy-6-metoxy-1,4-benzoquinol methylase
MSTEPADERQAHWEGVYRRRLDEELSWHQDDPQLSYELVRRHCRPGGKVIDVGGGSSVLASRLAATGELEVTVLDISVAALERARRRGGEIAGRIRWQQADMVGPAFGGLGLFDLWHDRAVFHFLVSEVERGRYVERALASVVAGGHLVVATFGPSAPERCSGLPVRRYDAAALAAEFAVGADPVEVLDEEHRTPSGVIQPFVYLVLRRRG